MTILALLPVSQERSLMDDPGLLRQVEYTRIVGPLRAHGLDSARLLANYRANTDTWHLFR